MKTYSILIIICIILVSCGGNKADQPAIENDTSATAINYAWQAMLNDSTGKLEMKKVEATSLDSLNLASIVDFINTSDSSVHLEVVKTSNDTVYIKIPDATYLTQRMGSTGSTMYLAGVVYNLTELPGIRYINFDFKEGDHAQPGTFNRDSFNNE
jgi:Sporulation and spore germination